MGIAIKKLFCELLFLMFQFLDSLTSMFKVLCGTEVLDANGEQITLIDLFLNSSPIISAFLSIFIISGIVIMISMIVAVFKKIIKDDGKKSHGKIAWQGLWAVVTSLVMATVMFGGIFFANTVLQLVDKATTPGEQDISISQQIFQMCLNDVAYEEKVSYKKKIEFDFNVIEGWKEEQKPVYDTNEDGSPKLDESGNPIIIGTETVREPIYKKVEVTEKDDDGNPIVERIEYVPIEGGSFQSKPGGGYYTIEDIRFSSTSDNKATSVNDVFGVRYKTLGLFEDENKSFEVAPMVRLDDFNVFLGYLAVIMLVVALVGSMLGLVKRVYDLVMLFLILPLVSGVIPLDDGARFKSWQSSVVSKVILAYGAVLSVNVYLLILPIILGINIPGIGNFGNAVFRLFLMIGGALCINGGQLLMARVFGTSAEESREMAQSARALAAGAAMAIHLPGRAMNVLGGQRVADGQGNLVRAGGLFGRGGFARTAGKVVGGMTNLTGNVLGGEAYRRPASAVAGVAGKAVDAVKQGFHGLTHVNRQQSMGSRNVAGSMGGGSNMASMPSDTSGTAIAANSGASSIGGGTQTNPTADMGAGTPKSQRTNPFKNGVIGAAVVGTQAVVNAGRNAIQSHRNNGLLPPLDTSRNNPIYSKPKANFTPKAETVSKNRSADKAQKESAVPTSNNASTGNKGIDSALGAVRNNKSNDSGDKKGQFKRRKK